MSCATAASRRRGVAASTRMESVWATEMRACIARGDVRGVRECMKYEQAAERDVGQDAVRMGVFEALWDAVRHGRVRILRELARHGVDLDMVDPMTGWTLVMLAAKFDQKDCLDELLRHRPLLDVKNDKGQTALHLAAKWGRKECLQLLLEHGAAIECADRYGRSAVVLALEKQHESCFRLLIEHVASVEMRDQAGKTLLALAAESDQKTFVQILLERGADLDARDRQGRTPLMNAGLWGSTECVKILMEHGADLEERTTSSGHTALLEAVPEGRDPCLRLLKLGASAWATDSTGRTALHMLLSYDLSAASMRDASDLIQLFTQYGLSADFVDSRGETPMHLAVTAWRSSAHMAQLLLSFLVRCGANINTGAEQFGCPTPLMVFARAHPESAEEFILNHRARISHDHMRRLFQDVLQV
ncbi:putative ankyrin repeat protein [Porphyridium purpureum]|uniref:Putative ankyrin repeat protein n=1 Tax=Porphyridium purpureum TaxID=35688 RepID=A0A5J4YZZ8_PORPP|nr:putative ankyrin repeat protein [Porphyridium purpureum]|eukprot:POR5882..scf208_2